MVLMEDEEPLISKKPELPNQFAQIIKGVGNVGSGFLQSLVLSGGCLGVGIGRRSSVAELHLQGKGMDDYTKNDITKQIMQ